MNGIILSAGKAESSLMQIFGDLPTGIIPVNGKPIIFHIIQQFIDAGIENIYISVGYNADIVIDLVKPFYEGKVNIEFVKVDYTQGPGNSLLKVIECVDDQRTVINLADTLVPSIYAESKLTDCVIVSKEKSLLSRWSSVEIDEKGIIKSIFEKEEKLYTNTVLCGVYIIEDISILKKINNTSILEISDLLHRYSLKRPLKAVEVNNWLDFGHLDYYQKSKKRLLEARFFNSLEFDDILGTITKRSTNSQKFIQEITWQLDLPASIRVLSPRILDYDISLYSPFVKMEYYSYPTAAELWLYSSFDKELFELMFQRIWVVLKLFYSEKREVSKESYKQIYITKTKDRLSYLANTNEYFANILEKSHLTINGKVFKNWRLLEKDVFEKINMLYDEQHNCLIHGDFCLSNILFDFNSGIVRVIDPRGNWGDNAFGDFKYDIAKLRHSTHGLYEFIVNDLFSINHTDNNINYTIIIQDKHKQLSTFIDNLISLEFDLSHIKVIEGLLFLSMIPYHANNQKRQIIMYSKAIEILNEVI
jgi:dTDP-glucose pyrophosphorylase